MKVISEVLKLTDPKEVRAELLARCSLLEELVGTLYPAILNEEIIQIDAHLRKCKLKDQLVYISSEF